MKKLVDSLLEQQKKSSTGSEDEVSIGGQRMLQYGIVYTRVNSLFC